MLVSFILIFLVLFLSVYLLDIYTKLICLCLFSILYYICILLLVEKAWKSWLYKNKDFTKSRYTVRSCQDLVLRNSKSSQNTYLHTYIMFNSIVLPC